MIEKIKEKLQLAWRKICDFGLWIRNNIKKIAIATGIIGIAIAGGDATKNEISIDKMATKYEQATELKSKYSLDGAILFKTDIKNAELDAYKGEPKDEVKVTLGDKDKTEFVPDIELKRWNEVSFKIKPIGLDTVATKDKTLSFVGDKISFGTPKISFEMYEETDTEEGGYKYVWYLNEKPTINRVEFAVESSGLDFFYQPPLTDEYKDGYSGEFQKEIVVTETQVKDLDGNVLVERPENVVGSYAVYHSTKDGMNDAYGKEYKTGQAFFIYRPHIIDAEGKETWGILHIENGIYSVEISQDFLDKAVYPIKSNDTFGYTTIGVSSALRSDRYTCYEAAPASNGTLTKITLYAAGYGGTNFPGKGVVYNDSSNARVGYGDQVLGWGSADWYDLTGLSGSIVSGTNYQICSWNGTDAVTGWSIYYNSSGANNAYKNSANYSDVAPADPLARDGDSTTKPSIYATYTPSGEGGTPTNPKTIIIESVEDNLLKKVNQTKC